MRVTTAAELASVLLLELSDQPAAIAAAAAESPPPSSSSAIARAAMRERVAQRRRSGVGPIPGGTDPQLQAQR